MANPTREIITFSPKCSKGVLDEELKVRRKKKQKAAQRRCIEEALILAYGPKYPKLCSSELLARVQRGESVL